MHAQLAQALLLSVGLASAMGVRAVQRRKLEWKRQDGRCPSCGRKRRNCSCV